MTQLHFSLCSIVFCFQTFIERRLHPVQDMTVSETPTVTWGGGAQPWDLRNGTGDFNRSPRQLRCEGEICIQILTNALDFIGFSLLIRAEALEEMVIGRIARSAFAATGEQLRCEGVVLVHLLALQFRLQFEFALVCDAFHKESLVYATVVVGG